MAASLAVLDAPDRAIFARGHGPVIGERVALPVLRGAGQDAVGGPFSDAVMHPAAHRLLAQRDAVLCLPGASAGADRQADRPGAWAADVSGAGRDPGGRGPSRSPG